MLAGSGQIFNPRLTPSSRDRFHQPVGIKNEAIAGGQRQIFPLQYRRTEHTERIGIHLYRLYAAGSADQNQREMSGIHHAETLRSPIQPGETRSAPLGMLEPLFRLEGIDWIVLQPPKRESMTWNSTRQA